MSEDQAIRLAKRGKAEGFERLYELHFLRVFSRCLRMIRDRAEAEDLTQEIFLQVFRKINTFRQESAFSTWLYRVAVNIVLQRIRRQSREEVHVQTRGRGEQDDPEPLEIATRDMLLAGCVDRIQLERAVRQLAPGYRLAFVLHDVRGLRHSEIAALLKRTVGNSKSQLHKARTRLRALLEPPEAAPSDPRAISSTRTRVAVPARISAQA